MTIDEVMAREREMERHYQRVLDGLRITNQLTVNYLEVEKQQHKQLAEWLEELKMLRELKNEHKKIGNIEGFNQGYNKAIDDFTKAIKEKWSCCGYVEELKETEFDSLAEQLKNKPFTP